jgi:hypothetical protein
MEPRQLFGVIVRVGGLAFLIFSIADFVHAVAHLAHLSIPSKYSTAETLWAACFYLAVGIVLVRGAEWIVRFAYGPTEDISN